MIGHIKAVIFDWGRTLHDPETGKEFPEAESVLIWCASRGYRLALASLSGQQENSTPEERKSRLEKRKALIENSPLRKFFELAAVTDGNKDVILEEVVTKLGLPREQILIVDDRILRGIKYGNLNGHPTVWLQKGKFADELPNSETKLPTVTIHYLAELMRVI